MSHQRSSAADGGRIVTDYEAYLFGEGHWLRAWEKMGARPARARRRGRLHVRGVGAERARCLGRRRFQQWDGRTHPLRSLGASGLWETFIPGAPDRHALQVRDPSAVRARRSPRPIPLRWSPSGRRAPPRSRPISAVTSGTTPRGWSRAQERDGARSRRCRSTRCTPDRGAAIR